MNTDTPLQSRAETGSDPAPEIVQPRRARQVVAVWGTVLALWVLSNVAMEVVLRYTQVNVSGWLVRSKWSLAERVEVAPDWLILGDSSGNQGVDPQIMADRLGGEALNLCVHGGVGTVNDVLILDRLIDRVGPPDHVVVVHAFDVWGRADPDYVRQPVPLTACFDPDSPMPLDLDEWAAIVASRLMPVAVKRKTLARLIKNPRLVIRQRELVELTEDGFMPVERADPENVADDSEDLREDHMTGQIAISDTGRRVLDRLQELSNEHGFDVYLVNSPLYKKVYNDSLIRDDYDEVNVELSAWASRDERLHHLFAKPLMYDADEMETADHLIEEAAADFTHRLCDAIQKARASNPALH